MAQTKGRRASEVLRSWQYGLLGRWGIWLVEWSDDDDRILGCDKQRAMLVRTNVYKVDSPFARSYDFIAALDLANSALPKLIEFGVSHSSPAFLTNVFLQIVFCDV